MSYPLSILVVDDQEEICEILCEYLAGDRAVVSSATNGAGMRFSLAHSKRDLVILDMWLPDGDAMALAAQASAIGVRVVLMTGHPDAMKNADRLPYPCLHKPFKLSDIREVVQAISTRDWRRSHELSESGGERARLDEGSARAILDHKLS
jgi:two-component system OmpR family response regulator